MQENALTIQRCLFGIRKKRAPIPMMRGTKRSTSYEYAYSQRPTSNLLSRMTTLPFFPIHLLIPNPILGTEVSQIVLFFFFAQTR